MVYVWYLKKYYNYDLEIDEMKQVKTMSMFMKEINIQSYRPKEIWVVADLPDGLSYHVATRKGVK